MERDEDVAPDADVGTDVLQAFLFEHGVTSHHVRFGDWMCEEVLDIVRTDPCITSWDETHRHEHTLLFREPRFGRPSVADSNGFRRTLWPHEALLQKQTYASPLLVDMLHVHRDHSKEGAPVQSAVLYKNFLLGELHPMVGSRHCWSSIRPMGNISDAWNLPGYYIHLGAEKIIVPVEGPMTNRIIITMPDPDSLCVEVRPKNERKWRSTSTMWLNMDRVTSRITVTIPFADVKMPLIAVMRMLGAGSLDNAVRLITTAGMDMPLPPDHHELYGSTYRRWVNTVLRVDYSTLKYVKKDMVLSTMPLHTLVALLSKQLTHDDTSVQTRTEQLRKLIDTELFPHISTASTATAHNAKLRYLAYIVWRLLDIARGVQQPDRKDDYATRQAETGSLRILIKFSQQYRTMRNSIKKKLGSVAASGHLDLARLVRQCSFTDPIARAMSSGNFSPKGNSKDSSGQGVTRALNRYVTIATLNEMCKIEKPILKNNKQSETRDVHPEGFGYIGPSNTADGSGCGLNNNFTTGATLSTGIYVETLWRALLTVVPAIRHTLRPWAGAGFLEHGEAAPWQRFPATPSSYPAGEDAGESPVVLFVNGVPMGTLWNASKVAAEIRRQRKRCALSSEVGVYLDLLARELYVECQLGDFRKGVVDTKGRALREVYADIQQVLDATPAALGWQALLRAGLVTMIGPLEERNFIVRANAFAGRDEENLVLYDTPTDHLHAAAEQALRFCAPHPVALFSKVVSLIVMANCNQAPRNTFFTCMSKNIMGYDVNAYLRTSSMLIAEPQRPLVYSKTERMMNMDMVPFGVNVGVTIAIYDGFNQEDSIIMNRASVDRGLFNGFAFHTTVDEISQSRGQEAQTFCIPQETLGRKHADYSKLRPDGTIRPGSQVVKGETVLIGKTGAVSKLGTRGIQRDQSTVASSLPGISYVDRVVKSHGSKTTLAVLERQTRRPEKGDKFSSRHGQKGVVGMLVNPEDLPFFENGVVPDLIINPHAMPSRMTIGQINEMMLSMYAILTGEPVDGTMFTGLTCEEMKAKLDQEMKCRLGVGQTCRFTARSGITGELLEGTLYRGYPMYERLRQQSRDKLRIRTDGPKNGKTRQPNQGKSKQGGFKLGYMENDGIQAHGAASTLVERMKNNSDPHWGCICSQCGLPCLFRRENSDLQLVHSKDHRPYCANCRRYDTVVNHFGTHASYSLHNMLMCMGIAARHRMEDREVDADMSAAHGCGGNVRRGDSVVDKRTDMFSYLDLDDDDDPFRDAERADPVLQGPLSPGYDVDDEDMPLPAATVLDMMRPPSPGYL